LGSESPGACINTTPSTTFTNNLAARSSGTSAKFYTHLQTKLHRKSNRRHAIRGGLVLSNLAILALIVSIVLPSPHAAPSTQASALANVHNSAAVVNPLDQVSSADIALTVARMSSLPESTAINNQAESQAVALAAPAVTGNSVISKPQVVSTALKSSADIQIYTSVSGDTISSLAQRFGVTSDSIRWSNNLTGDALTAGSKLKIPPVNGIVYTVKAGDTVDSLAKKFNANRDKIVAFNDAEIKGLVPGAQIVVPDGTQAIAQTAAQIARSYSASTSFPWGSSPIYGYNGYDYGYCTWYVANKISVPSNWGNANTWDNRAPRAGAVAQSDAGAEGHVAYVEAVSDDGSMIKYSDMNGLAGFGRVGYSDWVSASHFPHYIYR
jgi:surface antigen